MKRIISTKNLKPIMFVFYTIYFAGYNYKFNWKIIHKCNNMFNWIHMPNGTEGLTDFNHDDIYIIRLLQNHTWTDSSYVLIEAKGDIN